MTSVTTKSVALLNLGCGQRFHRAWTNLDLAPVGGWRDRAGLARGLAYSLLASALLAWCARMLIAQRRYKAQLEEQVALRTAEILAAQNQLKSTLDAIRDPIYELGLDGVIYSCSVPVGEKLRNWLQLLVAANTCSCSVKAMPSSRIRSHGRSDQEE